jgi:chromosomal replication initiation ATPase DnaA
MAPEEYARMITAPRQLALALDHPESFAHEDFLRGPSNQAALATIEQWPQAWPARALILVGPEGSGKSHLAAIWADAAGARLVAARALDPSTIPATLSTGALVVEDVVAGMLDERALFHLLNLARELDDFVLLTARTAPAAWGLGLRDLASRLEALPMVSLAPPDDALLRAVLVKLFADRQISVDESLIGYIATHIERSFAAVREIVSRLDAEGMRRKRPLSRALAAEMLRSRTA